MRCKVCEGPNSCPIHRPEKTRTRRYDGRMTVIDNWRFSYWRPFVCKVRGHKWLDEPWGIVQAGETVGWWMVCLRCVADEEWGPHEYVKPVEGEGG